MADELKDFMIEASKRHRLSNLESHRLELKVTQQMLSLNSGKHYEFQPAKRASELAQTAFKQVTFSKEENQNYKNDFLQKFEEKQSSVKNKHIAFSSIATTLLGATCFGVVGWFMLSFLLPIMNDTQSLSLILLYIIFSVVLFWKS